MSRKKGKNGPRGRGRRTDFANALRRGERTVFVFGSQILLLFLFLVFTAISASRNAPIMAAVGGIGVFLLARVLFPLERIVDFFEWVACGNAGEWLHNRYLSLMPGRSPNDRGRGQTTVKTLLALGTVVLLVSSLALGGVGGIVAAEDDENETNTASVTHDDYLTDPALESEFNDTSSVELIDRNVRTSIEETEAFVRIEAENPNAYPVEMTMKVHPDIIPPAEVGKVSSTNDEVTSKWQNTHDFERDESYTEITFEMDAESEVTFAPSRVRVLGIAWKDSTTSGDGLLDRVPNPFSSDDLDERNYRMNSSGGTIQTVPLENSEGQSIDDWHAVYRTGPDDDWKPISTDSSDPAFYRTTDGGEAVQFHFDSNDHAEGEVEVEFTANPNPLDTMKYDIRSFTAGLSDMINLDILSVGAPTPIAEVTTP
ncbi:hypothetical protein [Natronorubrum sp. DTA7]|uniref:hypothetical protein n=1 Tax=Natronorubrum sp. DTA7 TaxID=3447016 RepID=UPI003F8525EC